MQFTTKKTAQTPAPAPAKKPMTFEAAFDMAELCKVGCRNAKAICEKDLEACEIFHNLTVADILKHDNALETLGESNLKDLADAMNVSAESLKTMSMEDFTGRIEALMPDAGIAPATEGAAALAVAGIVLWIGIIVASAVAASKMTKYEFWFLDRSADAVLKEKGKKALDEVIIDCFDAKEFDKQIKACNEILDFLNKDAKEIYGEKTKIADIEKLALNLWSAPTSVVQTSNSSHLSALYTAVDEWFTGWIDHCPKSEMKSLRAHGFTTDSLVKTCETLIKMCTDYVGIQRTQFNFTNGHYEAKKKLDPGFWKSIKLFFTEKKEDREARKQEELILNAKLAACKNLMRGFNWCVSTMCSQFFAIAVKTEKYVKADK